MRRIALLLLMPVALVGLVACGARTPEALALGKVRAAAAATAAAQTGRLTATVGGQLTASAQVVARLDGTAADGSVTAFGAQIPVRVVDGVAYARVIGDRWFGVHLDRMGKAGTPADVADALQATRLLDALREVGDVKQLGSEPLAGAQTTHYQATVRVSDLAGKLPADAQSRLQERLGATVPVDVWVAADGLVRRARVDLGSGAQAVTVQVDVTDLGVPVNVTAPPADQVTMLGG